MCECVVILRNLKEVSWQGAKAMMSEGNFLRSLVEFDKDGLTEKQVRGWGVGGGGWGVELKVRVLGVYCSQLMLSGMGSAISEGGAVWA